MKSQPTDGISDLRFSIVDWQLDDGCSGVEFQNRHRKSQINRDESSQAAV
jgi:hypothetical protein